MDEKKYKRINYYNIYIKDISNLINNKPHLNFLNNKLLIVTLKYDFTKNRFKEFGRVWNSLEQTTKDKYKKINNYDEYLRLMDTDNKNIIDIYVDGSYLKKIKQYSYAFVIVKNGQVTHFEYGKDTKNHEIGNVAGELRAVIESIKYSICNNYEKINIHYDFSGIKTLALENCKPKTNITKNYRFFIKEKMEIISIKFIKIKSHSGNKYNNLADRLCRKAHTVE